MFVLAH
jgi:hypothetical protein